jgi:hypothetical protein
VLAASIGLKPKVTSFSLDEASEDLQAISRDAVDDAAVILPQ